MVVCRLYNSRLVREPQSEVSIVKPDKSAHMEKDSRFLKLLSAFKSEPNVALLFNVMDKWDRFLKAVSPLKESSPFTVMESSCRESNSGLPVVSFGYNMSASSVNTPNNVCRCMVYRKFAASCVTMVSSGNERVFKCSIPDSFSVNCVRTVDFSSASPSNK